MCLPLSLSMLCTNHMRYAVSSTFVKVLKRVVYFWDVSSLYKVYTEYVGIFRASPTYLIVYILALCGVPTVLTLVRDEIR